jgi:hypothetical protein
MKSWLTIHCLLKLAIVVMAVLMLSTDVMACPNCKNGMSGGDPLSVARASGYFYSILFMMSMPFLIVGTFGGAAYLSIKRARGRELTRE